MAKTMKQQNIQNSLMTDLKSTFTLKNIEVGKEK